jgi:hypothetical protein
MLLFSSLGGRDPIVVGGTGGSGTRALHRALTAAGVYMGANLNDSGDAMDFEPFLDETINPVLARTRSLNYRLSDLPPDLVGAARRQFRGALAAYLRRRPRDMRRRQPWGWKNPRSMYILPFILDRCPAMRFIHLVRDGRDMAVSSNQNQPRKHYAALFGEAYAEGSPDASIALWARANSDVAAWGRARLGMRYKLMRFEDLCAEPVEMLREALRWIGAAPDRPAAIAEAVAAIARPASLGRWHRLDADLLARLDAVGAAALRSFGYPWAP